MKNPHAPCLTCSCRRTAPRGRVGFRTCVGLCGNDTGATGQAGQRYRARLRPTETRPQASAPDGHRHETHQPTRSAHQQPSARPPCGGAAAPSRAAACVLAGVVLAMATTLPGATSEAHAATLGEKALRVAASKKGAPFQWGAAGPSRFDCSGLTQYAFKKVGKRLPRTAAAQYNRSQHLSARSRRAGDLVFFHSGNSVYHVAFYAGSNKVWHSPKPGRGVRLEKLWTKRVWYGRY